MRLHLNLLTLTLATSVAVPVVLTLPVATAPAATPHPVAPHVQHVPLLGVDQAAAGAATALGKAGASGPRVAVLTAPMTVHTFSLLGVAWDRSPPRGPPPRRCRCAPGPRTGPGPRGRRWRPRTPRPTWAATSTCG